MTSVSVVYADCPWKFSDALPGGGRGAEKHYDCMTVDELCRLELPPIADDALLFLWRVAAMQEEALAVMHMWGFKLKSEVVWVKVKNRTAPPFDQDDVRMGMGHYARQSHEVCLIGTRGRGSRLIKNHGVPSVFFAPRQEHSRKPDVMYDIIETLTGGEGPYAELFARRPREGWSSYGDELGVHLSMTG